MSLEKSSPPYGTQPYPKALLDIYRSIRLVTELRLAGATTIDDANRVLDDFLPRFNERFGVPSRHAETAYRVLEPGMCLDTVLCLNPNPPMRSGLGVGTRGEGRGTRRPALDPINGAGGGLWLSLGAPMAVLGSGAGAGSAGQHAGEDNRGPGRCDSVGRLGSLVDVSGAVGAVRQAMAGLAIEPGRE